MADSLRARGLRVLGEESLRCVEESHRPVRPTPRLSSAIRGCRSSLEARIAPDGLKCGVGNVRPRWSPDGQKIVFTSGRDGNFEVYLMNADGSNKLNLTNTALDNEFNPSTGNVGR